MPRPIPFLDAYEEQNRYNEQSGLRSLQEQSTLLQLKNAIQTQKQEQELKSISKLSGGSLDVAVKKLIEAGRYDIAAKLAPLVKARQPDAPSGYRFNAAGALEPIPGGPATKQTPPSGYRFKEDGSLEAIPGGPGAKTDEGPPDVRLVNFYHTLPATDPRKAILKRFIDEKTRIPAQTFPIVTSGDGIFERRPEGLVQLKDPKTGQPLKPTARERPITEYQGKNALYGTRALQSHKILNELEENINTAVLASKQAIQGAPVVGGPLGAAANVFLTADQQSVEQAQRNFVNAVLRQESGAVISEAEFENAKKQYFPAPGDSKQVIEQKRRNRVTAIEGFKKIAGPAWDEAASVGQSPQDILKQADEIISGKR